MPVNKVIFGNVVLIDTSEVTVTPDAMNKGVTALNAAGELITGTRQDAVETWVFTLEDDTTVEKRVVVS